MTEKQKILAEKHGTPTEFESAVWMAYDTLYITGDEAVAAINKYKREWEEAGNE